MTEKRNPFDSADPTDAIADAIRISIADAALRATDSPTYAAAPAEARAAGFVSGMMVGAIGSIIAITNNGDEGEMRALLRQHFDYWVDVALEINRRQPLGSDH